jgi:hypothetical protein
MYTSVDAFNYHSLYSINLQRNVGTTDENGLEEMSAIVKSMGSIAQRCINMKVSYLPKVY